MIVAVTLTSVHNINFATKTLSFDFENAFSTGGNLYYVVLSLVLQRRR
jgi:hypothetical protein